MRPGGDVLAGRTRKDLDVTTPTPERSPMSFFMATEDMLDRASTKSADPGSDSNFGVRSLQETIYEAGVDSGNREEDHRDDDDGDNDEEEESDENNKGQGKRRRSTLKPQIPSRDSSPEDLEQVRQATENGDSSRSNPDQRPPSYPSASHSVTSLSLASQTQGSSLPSSPKSTSSRSLRNSDEDSTDERGSQAILSSEDDEIEHPPEVQGIAPQLIMPSIKMPSRRPFTERGKDIGRLKILIAGDSGVGKTSLIKSIVQICEDIVHVDPLSSNSSSVDQLPPRRFKSKTSTANTNSTSHITEVYASTKAYPPWWSEVEESRILRRRKSMGDTVLERNLCFVDTPGYSHGESTSQSVGSVVQYIESQLTKVFSLANANDGELLSMLSGHGGTQVDVVFYMVLKHIKPVDLDFLRRLSTLTNVIPLVAKADLLSSEEAEHVKASISNDLESAGIKSFVFNPSAPATSSIYTVCSAASSDDDVMDASLLMSPDYIQPLLPSKLNELVDQIFDKDHISWLRHLAASKLVSTRREITASIMIASVPPASPNALQARNLRSPTSMSPTAAHSIVPYASSASSYVQTRFADHTQREEKLAQVRLAKWAGDLQRSLQNERARYEALSRGERAIWLTERLGECVNDGTLVSVQDPAAPSAKAFSSLKAESSGPSGRFADGGDPLGLLRWNEAMKRRGWIAFQVVGSFGVLGAMAVWMARSWGLGSDGYPGWTWAWWGW